MSVSLFSHSANPSIDPRLCRKSNSYVAELVRKGEAFMLLDPVTGKVDPRRAQLYAPKPDMQDRRHAMKRPIPGRNSCRKIRKGEDVFYKVDHFPYPIPLRGLPLGALGAKKMRATIINEPPKKPVSPWRTPPATEGLSE